MLLNFSPEERALLATVDACIDIPRSTKPAVARKLYDNLKRLITQLRGLAPVLEARGLSLHTKSATRVADARALLFKYQVPAEELIPRRRVYGDGTALEDACLQLRAAAYLRQGVAFEVQSPRYEPGQSADPEMKFRDDEDKIWPEAARTSEEHSAAAAYHRACASKASTLEKCSAHYKAADLHDTAARLYPDLNSRFAACAASKSIQHAQNGL
jgi:hypothetical protein